MSDIGSLVQRLVDAGLSIAEAGEIIATAFAAGVASAAVRKSSGAARQQRYRERNKASQSVTPLRPAEASQSVTNRNESVTRDATSLSKEVKKEDIRKEERGASQRPSRGHRLPDDWRPAADDRPQAIAKLGSGPAVEQEILKFHDYWKAQPGQRGVKLDWDATWRNWIRNAKVPNNGRRTVHDAARDLHEETLRRIAAFDEPAPRGLLDGAGEDVVRLLPARRRE